MNKTLNILIIVSLIIFNVFLFFFIFSNIKKPYKFHAEVTNAAILTGVEPCIILAVSKTESDFNEKAISKVGAIGIMQIMPETAKYVCEMYNLNYDVKDLYNAQCNLIIGSYYIKYLTDKFTNSDFNVVIASYNAGEGNVSRWLKNENYSNDGKSLKFIPFKETREYVRKVNNNLEYYKKTIT